MAPYRAAFLNDLTRDAQGNLYLSDSQAGFIARIEPAREHRVTIIARGPRLAGANGLSIQPKTGRLAVVTWDSGRVLEVTERGEVKPWLDRQFGKLDGADFDADGDLYFSAYRDGKVYRAAGTARSPSFGKDSSRRRTSTSTGRKGCCSSRPSTRGRSERSGWRDDTRPKRLA